MASDHELMINVRDGDIDKLGILFERYKKKLFNFFLMSLSDRQASEDLVQDVFMRILKYRHTYKDNGRFSVWMYGIARNARIDHYRESGTGYVPLDDTFDVENPGPGPEEDYEHAAQRLLLKRALAKLPDEMRELIIMSRYSDMKYSDIGGILGCSEGAVKVRMYRAMKELSTHYHTLEGGDNHEM